MKFLFFSLLFIANSYASPYQHGWGVKVKEGGSEVKIGGRLQAIAASDSETESQDFYFRRMRFNVSYKPWEGHQFVYDIRNDGANQGDEGEEGFVIGDAYWKIDMDPAWINNIKLFRAKVDVSYSQTSSSKNLFNPQRAEVSEHASDFVVHNRRAMNMQANGNLGNLAYQAVVSDGVNSGDLEDLSDNEISTVNFQKFTYGLKLRYFFFGDASKNKSQDTFYGNHDTFSLGIGHFRNDKIDVENTVGGLSNFSFNRNITNVDLSLSVKNFRLLSEYFAFEGDIHDLTQNVKENIIGESNGYYVQVEYLTGKVAPFVIYESFNKNTDLENGTQIVTTVGINFYDKMEARRMGLAAKKTENGEDIGDNSDESLYAYLMLNF